MKVKIVWTVIILATWALFFWGGVVTGRTNAEAHFSLVVEYANASAALTNYQAYRDIVLNITQDKNESAKCQAELSATYSFDIVKSCLMKQSCGEALNRKTREGAPEILGETPIPFERRSRCP